MLKSIIIDNILSIIFMNKINEKANFLLYFIFFIINKYYEFFLLFQIISDSYLFTFYKTFVASYYIKDYEI